MPTQFLNIVQFPVPLEIRNEALGLQRSVQFGSLAGTIYLPHENIANIDDGFKGLLPPRVRDIDWAIKVFNGGRTSGEHFLWGKYFAWHKSNPETTAIASVSHAALRINSSQTDGQKSLPQIAAECHKHLPSWHARLKEWIEVLTKDDLDADHPIKQVDGPEFVSVPWTYRENGKREYKYMNPVLILRGSHGKNALGREHWSSAIRGANLCLHPSEVRLLLRDARAALLRKNYRKTVLDAATATELLASPALRAELLRSHTPDVVDHLLKQRWQFSWKKDLLAKLGVRVPPDLASKLMDVRNKVIHTNEEITARQAQEGLAVAEIFADYLQPLEPP